MGEWCIVDGRGNLRGGGKDEPPSGNSEFDATAAYSSHEIWWFECVVSDWHKLERARLRCGNEHPLRHWSGRGIDTQDIQQLALILILFMIMMPEAGLRCRTSAIPAMKGRAA